MDNYKDKSIWLAWRSPITNKQAIVYDMTQESAFSRAIHQYRLSYDTAVAYSKYTVGEIDAFRMLYILEHSEGARLFYSSTSRSKTGKLLSWEGAYVLRNGVRVTHTKKGLKFSEDDN